MRLSAFFLVPAAALVAPSSLVAAPFPPAPVALSGTSPLAACGTPAGREPQRGAEVEPHVAASPDGRTVVAAWQQDRYRDGGAHGLGVSVSTDGGATWRPSVVPGATTCPPEGEDQTSDPWVTVGPDGAIYLSHIPGKRTPNGPQPFRAPVAVHRSTDGGRTWSGRFIASRGGTFADKESITADPRRPGTVYAVWGQDSRAALFSRSDDGGQTWSAPVEVVAQRRFRGAVNLVLSVLPDGALLVTYAGGDPGGGGQAFQAVRSDDGGATWSAPRRIAGWPARQVVIRGRLVRTGMLNTTAVAPDGTAHVAWARLSGGFRARGAILASRSRDGGRTWSRPRAVGRSRRQLFLPALAAAPDGTVGVSYYAFTRRSRTVVRLATSRDAGRTWRSRPLHRAFDFRTAPRAEAALFLGDYTGLTALGPGRFGAAIAVARRPGPRGRSDVRFAAVGPTG